MQVAVRLWLTIPVPLAMHFSLKFNFLMGKLIHRKKVIKQFMQYSFNVLLTLYNLGFLNIPAK